MKQLLSLILLVVFLVSCRAKYPITIEGGKNITIEIPMDVTPKPTPLHVSLSPITAENADQIALLYVFHVTRDVLTDDLLIISPDGTKFAVTPKEGAPLKIQGLNRTPDGSFTPMLGGFSSFLLLKTTSIAFSPDSTHLAAANIKNNSIHLFNLAEFPMGTSETVLPVGGYPEALAFTKDGKKLIIGIRSGEGGSLQLWDLNTGSLEREITENKLGDVCAMALSPDGNLLAASYCANPSNIFTWDAQTGYTPLSEIVAHDPAQPYHNNIFAFNPVTAELASSADFPRISIWDPRTGEKRAILTTEPDGDSSNGGDSVSTMMFTPSGDMLVMVANKVAQLIDAKDGKVLWLQRATNRMTALTMSADSKLLISFSEEGDLYFWGVPAE